jgi:tetratricopeptide (TPR) repeat protein
MTESATPSVGRVFISYRREETAYAAGWLFDRLVDRFGRDQIFKDVDSIQLGEDFVEVIKTAVGSCDVLIALVGNQWLTIADERGTRRLDNPHDFVRLEIEAALERNVRVIPVLVEGARMPRGEELPPSLAAPVRRNALELSPSRFEFDSNRLLRVLDVTVAATRAEPSQSEPGRAVARRQASLRALYVEARAEMRLGHLQTAIELLDDLLAVDASHRDAVQLRAVISQQLRLAGVYQRAIDAEAAGEWADAASAYAEILDADASYRDAAARRAACEARQQVLDLQGELRHHAAAEEWEAVLAVNDELATLDPAAADPDRLASTARDQLARRQEGERGAERRPQVAQLQQQIREHAAAEDWDAVLAVNDELAGLDPAAADPDRLASTAHEQLARRQQAEEAPSAADEPTRDPRTPPKLNRGRSKRRIVTGVAIICAVAATVAVIIAFVLPGGAKTNGLEKQSASQVLQAVGSTLTAAKSVHLAGAGSGTDELMQVDLRIQGDAVAGTLGPKGTQSEVRKIGNAIYIKAANQQAWQALGAPAAVQSLAGKWVKLRPDQIKQLDLESISLTSLAASLTSPTDSPLQPTVERTTREGKKVVVISKQNGDKLYVANTGPAYPLHVEGIDGRFDLTEYDTYFPINPPSEWIDQTR